MLNFHMSFYDSRVEQNCRNKNHFWVFHNWKINIWSFLARIFLLISTKIKCFLIMFLAKRIPKWQFFINICQIQIQKRSWLYFIWLIILNFTIRPRLWLFMSWRFLFFRHQRNLMDLMRILANWVLKLFLAYLWRNLLFV